MTGTIIGAAALGLASWVWIWRRRRDTAMQILLHMVSRPEPDPHELTVSAAQCLGIRIDAPLPRIPMWAWQHAFFTVLGLHPAEKKTITQLSETIRRSRVFLLHAEPTRDQSVEILLSGQDGEFRHSVNCVLLGKALAFLVFGIAPDVHEAEITFCDGHPPQPCAKLATSQSAIRNLPLEAPVAPWATALHLKMLTQDSENADH